MVLQNLGSSILRDLKSFEVFFVRTSNRSFLVKVHDNIWLTFEEC